MVAENSTMLSSLLNRIISYFSIISKKNKPKRMTKKMRPSFEDSLQFVNFDRMDSDSHKTIVLSESCYSSNQASPTQTPRRSAGDFVILDHSAPLLNNCKMTTLALFSYNFAIRNTNDSKIHPINEPSSVLLNEEPIHDLPIIAWYEKKNGEIVNIRAKENEDIRYKASQVFYFNANTNEYLSFPSLDISNCGPPLYSYGLNPRRLEHW